MNKKIIQNKKRLKNSFKYAFEGIKSALKEEQNLKIHFVIMIVVIILGIIFKIEKMEWIVCIILCGLVISLELVNTAIETVVDLVMPDINPKAKVAKDVSAAAVLVVSISSAIVGAIIFVPYFFGGGGC